MTRLAQALKAYRQRHDIGVRALAREIGTSHATLSRIERGYPMDLATWLKVQAWLLGGR